MPRNFHRLSPFVVSLAVLVSTSAIPAPSQGLARLDHESPGAIQWRALAAQRLTPPATEDHALVAARRLAQLAQEPKRHVIVQFDRPVTGELRATLSGAGVILLRYLGENAFFA